MLRELKLQSSFPWLIGGDLNEILYNFEKQGGPPKPQTILESFKGTLKECDLYDLGFLGHKFTWWNRQSEANSVEERLDRFCADSNYSSLFPYARFTHLDDDFSDHLPILLQTAKKQGVTARKLDVTALRTSGL